MKNTIGAHSLRAGAGRRTIHLTMAADEAKVKALAEYVAGKSAATGVTTRGAAAQLASSYSDFISDNSAGKKAMLAEQRQYQELEQLLDIQRPAARDAATWQARRDAVAAVGAGDSQTASAVAAQLARAREAAAAFSDDSLASSKAEHAGAGAAHHFDASIALTNFGVNPPHDDAAGRSQHPRQTDTLPAAGARAHAGLCGVGMKLKMLESGAQITEIVHDSPAWRSALAVGDSIVAVDGDSVLGSSLAQVVSKLMGVEGSSVSVTIATGGCVVLRRHKSAGPVAPSFSAPATATLAPPHLRYGLGVKVSARAGECPGGDDRQDTNRTKSKEEDARGHSSVRDAAACTHAHTHTHTHTHTHIDSVTDRFSARDALLQSWYADTGAPPPPPPPQLHSQHATASAAAAASLASQNANPPPPHTAPPQTQPGPAPGEPDTTPAAPAQAERDLAAAMAAKDRQIEELQQALASQGISIYVLESIYVCVCVCACVHACMHARIDVVCVCLCACMHTNIHTNKQTNIHTYILTHTHTYTHTHTHTYVHTAGLADDRAGRAWLSLCHRPPANTTKQPGASHRIRIRALTGERRARNAGGGGGSARGWRGSGGRALFRAAKARGAAVSVGGRGRQCVSSVGRRVVGLQPGGV